MALAEIPPARVLDVVGKVCPYPLIETRNALQEMKAGEVLLVVTDQEMSALETIPGLARKKGYPLETSSENGSWRLYIQKKEGG